MLLPTPRAALLLAVGSLLALWAIARPAWMPWLFAFDGAVLAAAGLDAWRARRSAALEVAREMRDPLAAFVENPITLQIRNPGRHPLSIELADGPPASFHSRGHRRSIEVPAHGSARVSYSVRPLERGVYAFGDVSARIFGPWGLGMAQRQLPLRREVRVYPELRATGSHRLAGTVSRGRARNQGWSEGREFAALRGYVVGDDIRAIDWKSTAKRGAPIVKEYQPERNQSIWILVDCGRHLAGRLLDGRTKLDHAVDAAMALARAAAARGDQVGVITFAAEVFDLIAPGRGSAQLGPIAQALFLAQPRVEESDYDAAFDALLAKQHRRSLVLILTDIDDPDTSAVLLARLDQLRRRHLTFVAAVADTALDGIAHAVPARPLAAYARVAAERILWERELARQRLESSGVMVTSVTAAQLTSTIVDGYLLIKQKGRL